MSMRACLLECVLVMFSLVALKSKAQLEFCTTEEGFLGRCVAIDDCHDFSEVDKPTGSAPGSCDSGYGRVVCCIKHTSPEPPPKCGLRVFDGLGLLRRKKREESKLANTAKGESSNEHNFKPGITVLEEPFELNDDSDYEEGDDLYDPTGPDYNDECESDPTRCVYHVSGGYDASYGQWPWVVALGTPKNSDKAMTGGWKWFCGGSLVSDRHVLTAAHCVSPHPDWRENTIVRLGAYDLGPDSVDTWNQDRRVVSVRQHEKYNKSHNDIAMLTLSEPAHLDSAVVRTVCLPEADDDHLNQSVLLAGWGLTEFAAENQPDFLQEAPLTVYDEQKCEKIYSTTHTYEIKFPGGFGGTKLCATDPRESGDRDACQGDSGGPLVHQDANTGQFYMVGIVSEGIGCGNPTYPGIYTKVSKYIPWIRKAME